MASFPPTSTALEEPNGLLAVGGDLSPQRLLQAYRQGIFPWYEQDDPILWWTPNPRAVLYPEQFRVAKSFRKFLAKCTWQVTLNQHFHSVISSCAARTEERQDTWISDDMLAAYLRLHDMGYAHSVEVLDAGEIVGGLYGIQLGDVFFGESMFSRRTNASKVALYTLCQKNLLPNLALIDCQLPNPHLESLGMTLLSRTDFEAELVNHLVGASGH